MNDSPPCDVCGAAMLSLHCKLICRNCGYRRDCSDPHHPTPTPIGGFEVVR